MTAKLGLSSPWTRAAFTDEQRAEIEARIPDGCRIVVTGDAAFGGRRFTLRGYEGDHETIVMFARYNPVEAALHLAGRLAELVAA